MAKHSGGPLDLLLSRLANAKRHGDRYMCSCPAHGGHDCLTVKEEGDKVLVHCFAGCSAREVVESVDLHLSDLFADSLNPEKRREYEIKSLRSAREHAVLIMDLAGAQIANDEKLSEQDQTQLDNALELLKECDQKLAELELSEPEEQPNPFLARLSYDADAELDRIASQQWLIDQIIPVDAFGVIYGPSSTYKSFHAMDIAAAIASGQKWHGHDLDNQGHVLYIGAEGAAGLQARKKAWEIRHDAKLMDLGILSAAPTINNAMDCQYLIELCDAIDRPTKLIVVDTLARTFAGEENSAADMGDFIRACDYLRGHTGATVLVIHHSGKDAEKGARGSSALRAACDFEYQVTRTGDRATKLKCTKAKDSEPMEETAFAMQVVELGRQDAKGREMKSLVPKMQAQGESMRDDLTGPLQILNNLIGNEIAKNGGWAMRDFVRESYYWATGVKVTDKAAKEAARKAFGRGIAKLVDDGWIIMDEDGKITRDDPF